MSLATLFSASQACLADAHSSPAPPPENHVISQDGLKNTVCEMAIEPSSIVHSWLPIPIIDWPLIRVKLGILDEKFSGSLFPFNGLSGFYVPPVRWIGSITYHILLYNV